VQAHRLGTVHTPRSVVRTHGNEVEPDLMVRPFAPTIPLKWEDAPLPLLVIEALSSTTRRRDHEQKRAFYRQCGIAEYWIVDGNRRTIRVVKARGADVEIDATLVWWPEGATEALTIDVAAYFHEVLGG
jgi:Uma2 family endonuclease